jgi:hypothetical protein
MGANIGGLLVLALAMVALVGTLGFAVRSVNERRRRAIEAGRYDRPHREPIGPEDAPPPRPVRHHRQAPVPVEGVAAADGPPPTSVTPDARTCGSCGSAVNLTARFCRRCGSPLA